MKHSLLVVLGLTFSLPSIAAEFSTEDLTQGYQYLNTLRSRAGMIPFTTDTTLQQAAMGHAEYLTTNNMIGHVQADGLPNFTGTLISDRTSAAGYQTTFVTENVSSGSATTPAAIDQLMSAIYHRFGFLDFDVDTVGIGISQVTNDSKVSGTYVFNMSNTGLNQLCSSNTLSTGSSSAFGVCASGAQLDADAYQDSIIAVQGNNANVVQWPAPNETDFPPAFFEESPDPLPDLSVSGNPISVQFNPLVHDVVTVSRFELFRASDGVKISNTRLLNQNLDPNSKFTALEFALFPLDRLDWNTEYRAELDYSANGETQNLTWSFKTRDLGVSIYTAEAGTVVVPTESSHFAIYLPTSEGDSIHNIAWNDGRVDIDIIDGNTLSVSNWVGSSLTINYAGGSLTVMSSDSVTTPDPNIEQPSPTDPNTSTETTCTASECDYSLTVTEAGFYVATVNLPSTANEGFWGLSVNTSSGMNSGGFNAGAILKENGDVPGFVGFYLAAPEAVTMTGYEYSGTVSNLLVSIKRDNEYVVEPTLIQSAETRTTDVLEAGFYVAEVFSQNGDARGRSGISLNGNQFTGGVNIGGWIDSTTGGNGEGFGAFYVEEPQTVNLKLLFGSNYGEVGAGQPNLNIYLQNADGSRTLYQHF